MKVDIYRRQGGSLMVFLHGETPSGPVHWATGLPYADDAPGELIETVDDDRIYVNDYGINIELPALGRMTVAEWYARHKMR